MRVRWHAVGVTEGARETPKKRPPLPFALSPTRLCRAPDKVGSPLPEGASCIGLRRGGY